MVCLVCVCERKRNRGRESESGREREGEKERTCVSGSWEEGWLLMFELPQMLKGRVKARIQQRQRNRRLTGGRILFIICGEAEKIWQCLLK